VVPSAVACAWNNYHVTRWPWHIHFHINLISRFSYCPILTITTIVIPFFKNNFSLAFIKGVVPKVNCKITRTKIHGRCIGDVNRFIGTIKTDGIATAGFTGG
jgi:hypothetical protein